MRRRGDAPERFLFSAGPACSLVKGTMARMNVRQMWAAVRGDRDAAFCHAETRRLVGDVCRGRDAAARKRIRTAAAFLDPVAAEQDGRTG